MPIVPEPPRVDTGESRFLHIQGFIHTIDLSPAGPRTDPWPFSLTVDAGNEQATCLVYEDDAEKLVEFFQRHLGEPDG